MFRQGIHHNSKSQQVTPRGKHEKHQLCELQHIATDGTQQDLASISHTMHQRISLSELTDYISRVCRDEAQANDEDDGSAISSVLGIV